MSSTETETIAARLIETIANSVKSLNADQKRALLAKIEPSAFDGARHKLVDQRHALVTAVAAKSPNLIREINASLKRVGLTVDAVLAGGIDAVDKAAKARGLSVERRFELKSMLREIGAL